MSKENVYYTWAYYTEGIDKTCVNCKICGKFFVLSKNYTSATRHIQVTHYIANSTASKINSMSTYSITEDNRIKCNFCNKD